MIFTVVKQVCTREHAPSILRGVRDDGKRDVNRRRTLTPKVNVVGICNVMNDELARIRVLSASRGSQYASSQAKSQQEGHDPH